MDEYAVEITLMISGEECWFICWCWWFGWNSLMCCISFSSSTGSTTGARGSYITDEGVTIFLMHVVTFSPTYGKTASEETDAFENPFGVN
ncbi:hypothetical protein F2Q69_00007781 [Brassica cretica]|uniref:Uncharacterized protein n=1 Tax=Brassica cretica TaxID=69181 RepID=A0A8S9NMP5_BRACR|nr:hypothetical protein F2Q69_00007781 [Brassica cretica]